jgi:hypothetical protein
MKAKTANQQDPATLRHHPNLPLGDFPKKTYRKNSRLAQSILKNAHIINQRRAVLIDKEYAGKITDAELKEPNHLQRLASLRRQLLAPYPMDELRQERERLKPCQKWPMPPCATKSPNPPPEENNPNLPFVKKSKTAPSPIG